VSPVFGHGRLRLYLLKVLDEGPRHGYDIIRELEDRFMGMYAPSAGTIYPRLARLESEGLVTHTEEEGRKVYRITDAGRVELQERHGELDDLEDEIAGSVRDLAAEIRSEVSGSVKSLREELKAAAKDVRRQGRRAGRAQPVRVPSSGDNGDSSRRSQGLDRVADTFRAQLRDSGRGRNPSDGQLDAVREVLEVALDEVRREVSPQPGRVKTTLPKTSPCAIRAKPSRASSSGRTESITGRTPVSARKRTSLPSSSRVPIVEPTTRSCRK
jgi:DNA-binding PadR family transcriptional regulator